MSINKLQLKRSAVVGKIPNTASLDLGELAINTVDGKIYFKQETGSIQRIVELTSTSGSHLSASYAETASYSDQFRVGGTLTAQTLVVQTISSSIIYSSGSNTFGNSLTNNQRFTGSVDITGSLTINGRNYLTDSASFDTRIGYVSSSFNTHTASFNAFSSSILSTTASINAFSASALLFTASTLVNSASFDNRINYLSSSFESNTASFNAYSASINAFSASVLTFTSSTLVNSSSFDTRIKYVSSSFEAATASLNLFSASMLSTTASMNAFSASMLSFTASQKNSNGTFATTGSNTFYGVETVSGSVLVSGSIALQGNQNIVGNLTVTDTITAQKLVVQTITSSVIYSSGSNIFGDAASDTQTFTGSVNISGSLNLVGDQNINTGYELDVDTINVNTITDRNEVYLKLNC